MVHIDMEDMDIPVEEHTVVDMARDMDMLLNKVALDMVLGEVDNLEELLDKLVLEDLEIDKLVLVVQEGRQEAAFLR